MVKEELGDVSDRYPYEIYPHNVFQASAAMDRDRELGKLGYSQEVIGSLTYPVMTVNGKAYLGMDSISQSLREVRQRAYDLLRPDALLAHCPVEIDNGGAALLQPVAAQQLFQCLLPARVRAADRAVDWDGAGRKGRAACARDWGRRGPGELPFSSL